MARERGGNGGEGAGGDFKRGKGECLTAEPTKLAYRFGNIAGGGDGEGGPFQR